MMAKPWTCVNCDAKVIVAVDSATDERVLVDPARVFGGQVLIFEVAGRLIARDYITTPAPTQPAYQLHDRSCSAPPAAEPVDLDDDPAMEQSRGWRQ